MLSYLGWEQVRAQLQKQDLANMDPLRWQILLGKRNTAGKAIPGAIRQAYTTVVTMSEAVEVEAFKITVGEPTTLSSVVKQSCSSVAASRTGVVAAFYPPRPSAGPEVYRISEDGGLTWGEELPSPPGF